MPHTFDMDWDALQSYMGRNPKPVDHAAYWEKGLSEMMEVDPQLTLTEAEFQAPFAECYDMTFTGVGGARIYSKLIRPKGQTAPGPAVLMFHGYTGNSGDWLDKLPYAAAGITVAALDCRGQGGRSNDNGVVSGHTMNGQIIRGLQDAIHGEPEKLLFRQIFLDTAQLAHIVMGMEMVDEARVGVTGYSQGGALAVVCAALVPKIVQAAPVYPYLSDYQRIWEMDLAVDAYGELQEWFRRFDPQHKRTEAVFTQLGYIDIQHLAKRIQAKTLWFVGLADMICPPSSQFAAYNKILAEKEMAIYPDFAHEDMPGRTDQIFEFMLKL